MWEGFDMCEAEVNKTGLDTEKFVSKLRAWGVTVRKAWTINERIVV